MIVTIDLNVILDIYLLRGDFDAAMSVLSLCKRGTVAGNIPSHGLPTIYYILSKSIGAVSARKLSGQLIEVLDIIPVDKNILREAYASSISDVEDAIVEASAARAKSNYIITGNIRDFKSSRVAAISPAKFLQIIRP